MEVKDKRIVKLLLFHCCMDLLCMLRGSTVDKWQAQMKGIVFK
ncbi:hypothetical protein NEOC65_001334 [Neochlamydia sp. AcF65]|nr:hypothetical protein [Neochlamydia sp. AcF65]